MFEFVVGGSLYTAGLPYVLNPHVLSLIFIGTVFGVMVGTIPGLNATIAIAIATPMTLGMSVYPAIGLLMGIYCGAMFGGSISAILVNIPGTPAALMTRVDGYPLSMRGEAGKAIGLACVASFTGGCISAFVLSFMAPPLGMFSIRLNAQEYFAVCLFGLSVIAYISTGDMLKGFICGLVGLIISTVGMDPLLGVIRFNFGRMELMNGFERIAIMIGLFGIAEIFKMAEESTISNYKMEKMSRVLPRFKDLVKMWGTFLRGSLIGVFIGAVPATGGSIGAILSYGVEKRISKNPENFGKGEMRGIIAPECANNAVVGGAMIPMLTLGIPGDIVTAVLIGSLMLHGLQPGPILFHRDPQVVSAIFIMILVAGIMFLFLGLFGARYFAKVIALPKPVLVTMILSLAMTGTFSVRNSIFDVWVLLFAGVIGFIMNKVKLPTSPVILGLVLGDLAERYFRQGLVMSFGNVGDFISRPISAFFLSLTLFVIISPFLAKLFKKVVLDRKS